MISIETATTPLDKETENINVKRWRDYCFTLIFIEINTLIEIAYLNSILCLKESQPKNGEA